MQLKTQEKQILTEIDLNARNSAIKIAKKLKLHKSQVNSKIKLFEEKGLISKYYTVINFKKFGFKKFKILIKLNSYDEKIINQFYKFTSKFDSLNYFQVVYSKWDIILTFNEKSLETLYETYQEISFKFAKYIQNKELTIVQNEYFYSFPFVNFNNKPLFELKTTNEIYELSNLEKDILKNIQFNGKIPIVELANKLGKKANSLLYNLKTLEKNEVILTYKPRINTKILGLSQYMVFLSLKNLNKATYKSFIRDIRMLTGAIYISARIGNYDLEFEVLCKNELDLREKINLIIQKYSDSINEIDSLLILKYLAKK